MTQHTPGPWTAQKDLRSYRNTGIITDGPFAWGIYGTTRVARIEEDGGPRTSAVVDADARLIAAAPDLLELVRAAYDRFTDNDFVPANHALQVWLTQAEAAIAKATGGAE